MMATLSTTELRPITRPCLKVNVVRRPAGMEDVMFIRYSSLPGDRCRGSWRRCYLNCGPNNNLRDNRATC